MLFSMKLLVFYATNRKNTHERKLFKSSTLMCIPSLRTIHEIRRSRGPLTPYGFPPDPADLTFPKINSLPFQIG